MRKLLIFVALLAYTIADDGESTTPEIENALVNDVSAPSVADSVQVRSSFSPDSSSPLAIDLLAPAPPPKPAPVRQPKVVSQSNQNIASNVNYRYEVNPDGSYEYGYENDDGTAVGQQGQQKPVDLSSGNVVQGFYKYTGPKGEPIEVRYISDENGYQPLSDAIPTPPPIPPYILRALAWIANHPAYTEEVKRA